ncbi:MAG: hypothetical protein JWM98_1679 [Thermoleophilia bacterium]|nr:hypothetical protein [Thermoleophilia bacterium]
MSTYQVAAPAPSRSSGGVDVAAWALVALVVAVVCAGAGWAIARQDSPGTADVARTADLAGRDGLVRGQQSGYVQGADQGRREAALRAKGEVATARQQASRDGYQAGYDAGRQRNDPGYVPSASTFGAGADASSLPDPLETGGLGADVPGYSTSAFDGYGYGASAQAPYTGTSAGITGNSPGDDLGY